MVWRTEWAKVTCPAIESSLASHPVRRFCTRERTCSKCFFLTIPVTRETPKYLPKDNVIERPHTWAITSFSRIETLQEKIIAILIALTFWLEVKQKDYSTLWIARICEVEAFAKSNTSSTKRRWEMSGPYLPSLHFPSLFARRMRCAIAPCIV